MHTEFVVQFAIRDRSRAQGEAIAQATSDADSKAKAEAAALNVKLGTLISNRRCAACISPGIGAAAASATGDIAASVRTRLAVVDVRASVVLTYAIR